MKMHSDEHERFGLFSGLMRFFHRYVREDEVRVDADSVSAVLIDVPLSPPAETKNGDPFTENNPQVSPVLDTNENFCTRLLLPSLTNNDP